MHASANTNRYSVVFWDTGRSVGTLHNFVTGVSGCCVYCRCVVLCVVVNSVYNVSVLFSCRIVCRVVSLFFKFNASYLYSSIQSGDKTWIEYLSG